MYARCRASLAAISSNAGSLSALSFLAGEKHTATVKGDSKQDAILNGEFAFRVVFYWVLIISAFQRGKFTRSESAGGSPERRKALGQSYAKDRGVIVVYLKVFQNEPAGQVNLLSGLAPRLLVPAQPREKNIAGPIGRNEARQSFDRFPV